MASIIDTIAPVFSTGLPEANWFGIRISSVVLD